VSRVRFHGEIKLTMKTLKLTFASLSIILAAALPAMAVPRVFVSGLGNDANPGSLTSPKRSFTSALTVTDAGGEIIVLDSAGYGPVTINKSVTINSPSGVYAGVTVTSGDGIAVSAGASDVVILRGLTINGAGGNTGIHITAAGAVHVESCVVSGFAGDGQTAIFCQSAGQVFVADTVVRGNFNGIAIISGKLSADRCRLENNSDYGLFITSANGSISKSVASGNLTGFNVAGGDFNIDDCLAANNSGEGIFAQSGGVARASNSTFTDNGTGWLNSGGSILSRGDNTVRGNVTNKSGTIGSFTAD
jgi:parallel beta helix pectate lyase-like protein